MSHIAAIDLVISDLPLVEAVITDLGGVVVDQSTYTWYGRNVGDSRDAVFEALEIEGVTRGVCAKAFRPAGWKPGDYEGGIVRLPDGTYRLVWDSWSTGRNLDAAFGKGGGRIKDHMGAALSIREAARQGLRARKTIEADGTVAVDVFVEG